MSEMDSRPIDIEDDFQPQLSLNTIPVEIFLHICTFLDGKEMLHSLKSVCQSFYAILSDDSVWRTWLKHRWPELPTSNLCYKDDTVPSQTVCLHIDRGLRLWSKEEGAIKKWVHDAVHISTVDTVKLIQGGRIGVSGARDRSLAVWGTSGQLGLLEHRVNAHDGWIWDLALCPQTKRLYSCSWDSQVKLWTLEQQLQQVATFTCKAAALSMACRESMIAVGLFTPLVELFDARVPGLPLNAYTSHTRSIMSLCIVRDFIVSASEDRTLSVWDIKAGKVFKSGIQVSSKGHPMAMSFSEGNLLFVGDTKSRLHIFDTTSDSFELQDSFELGHAPREQITSMWHNPGFVVTGSQDSTVRIHSATRPPHFINKLTSTHGGITAVDFADPVLFVGCVNNAVEMWMPC